MENVIPMDLEYIIALQYEASIRQGMYDPNIKKSAPLKHSHYALQEIEEEWLKGIQGHSASETNLLFSDRVPVPRTWNNVQASLKELDFLLKIPGVYVAGGRIFSALFSVPSRDVDIFLCGLTVEKAKETVWEIFNAIKRKHPDYLDHYLKITRTKNALTFSLNKKEYQIILRLYKTFAEVLHGFDVDSCCLGYDGKIWMTPRAKFALEHGYNTVNFKYLSPSYEWRLVKYATRGFSIKILDLDPGLIQVKAIEKRFRKIQTENEEKSRKSMSERYKAIKGRNPLQGLDILLYMEYHCQEYSYRRRMISAVEQLTEESSDYNPIPYKRINHSQSLEDILQHILVTADKYPVLAAKYAHYFIGGEYMDGCISNGYSDPTLNKILRLSTNSFLLGRSIDFISSGDGWIVDDLRTLKLMCDLPERLYLGLGEIRPWNLPRQLEFKVTNPGEQMTGTFHQTVLENPETWYYGEFYRR